MSTRSRIAKKQEDGTYRSIYCHFDGYPEHNGLILHENYRDPEKIDKLLDLGSLSILAPEIGEKQDFEKYPREQKDWCLAYGRDRGEENTEAKFDTSVYDLIGRTDESCGEWIYLYEDGVWKVFSMHEKGMDWRPLSRMVPNVTED